MDIRLSSRKKYISLRINDLISLHSLTNSQKIELDALKREHSIILDLLRRLNLAKEKPLQKILKTPSEFYKDKKDKIYKKF